MIGRVQDFILQMQSSIRDRWRSPIVFVALLVVGCVSVPERPPVSDPAATWDVRQAALAHLDHWDLRGRLALRTNDEGVHASLHWVRNVRVHRMSLAGPFGGGQVRLIYDDNSAELRDAQGDTYRGTSAREVMERVTGWRLPVEGLNYWVLGLPEPGVPATTELDAWGRLSMLEQRGWRVRIPEYTQERGFELPKRIFISREPDSGELLEARIAIEQWALQKISARN